MFGVILFLENMPVNIHELGFPHGVIGADEFQSVKKPSNEVQIPSSLEDAMAKLRDERSYISTWPAEPVRIEKYKEGDFKDPQGNTLYHYPAGEILHINGFSVMGTCERPWAERNVALATETLSEFRTRPQSPHQSLFVIQGGFGLGMDAEEWINKMFAGAVKNTPKGGDLLIFELNEANAKYGDQRLKKKIKRFDEDTHLATGSSVRINAQVKQMDFLEGIQEVREKIKKGEMRKADAISLDLFDPEQRHGMTDFMFMDLIADCLANDGVLTLFAYNKDTGAKVSPLQDAVLQHFGFDYIASNVRVYPNPEYDYLVETREDGHKYPERSLPVVVAWKKYDH